MSRPIPSSLLRQSTRVTRRTTIRRSISTVPPPQRSRSWRSSAIRWGIALGGLYYYNTNELFADAPSISPSYPPSRTVPEPPAPTLESIAAERRQKQRNEAAISTPPAYASSPSSSSPKTIDPSSQQATNIATGDRQALEDAEEETEQQGAYNEETGEINWDCPCLGGMADGPCGEQFKEAFSCFVHSKEDPKGMDCIEHFKTMQGCFKEHPDHYGDEFGDDDDELDEAIEGSEAQNTPAIAKTESPSPAPVQQTSSEASTDSSSDTHADSSSAKRVKAATDQVASQHPEPQSETDELVPKAWHDTTEKNKS